jgi:drug/metabolite transporter (DMT)-like permease
VIEPATANYVRGAAYGLSAVSIWASLSAVTRMAVTTNLNAWDIAALRYGVAGLLLAPVILQRGLARERLGPLGLVLMIAGAGAPYALLQAGGLRFASAADQGALNPGFMPLFVAMISAFALGEKLSIGRKLGLSLILVGALMIVALHAPAANPDWLTSPPLYAKHLAQIPLADLLFQAIFQGVLVTVLALVLYARAVAILGASGGAAFGALVPLLSALFAIPLLREWPTEADWLALALVSTGVYWQAKAPCRAGRNESDVRTQALRASKASPKAPSPSAGI